MGSGYIPEDNDSPELHSAYEELAAAIKKIIVLNKWDVSSLYEGAPLIMSEFIVLVAQQGFDRDGDGISSYPHILPHGEMSWHRMIGLIRSAQLKIEHEFIRDDDD